MLRQLIKDGHIAPGEVDERNIIDVKASDLKGYTQCHFFAGIGGWSVGLRMAKFSDERSVWTGSCPCQPFSNAGSKKGKQDERHLWPVWFKLIRELRPATIFGEQVASSIAKGWLDDVYDDLERTEYAVGSAVLPACSVGAPHQRYRLWFVAQSTLDNDNGNSGEFPRQDEQQESERPQGWGAEFSSSSAMGNSDIQGLQGRELHAECSDQQSSGEDGLEWINCPDGKQRPVKRGIRLLAHGVQYRTPILHAFGNAIVPTVAAEFIKAAM